MKQFDQVPCWVDSDNLSAARSFDDGVAKTDIGVGEPGEFMSSATPIAAIGFDI